MARGAETGGPRGRAVIAVTVLVMLAGPAALPPAVTADSAGPRLDPGCTEASFSASLSSVSGDTRVRAAVGLGRFLAGLSGLISVGAEAGYVHVSGLDAWDLEALVTWGGPVGSRPVYPFLSLGGGLRQEHVGSFGSARYPVGGGAGLRMPVSRSAGVRLEYRFRRVLNDPVADFSEHRVDLGVALYLGNRGERD